MAKERNRCTGIIAALLVLASTMFMPAASAELAFSPDLDSFTATYDHFSKLVPCTVATEASTREVAAVPATVPALVAVEPVLETALPARARLYRLQHYRQLLYATG